MHELVEPSVEFRESWLLAHGEWGPGLHEDGFGLRASDDVTTVQGFDSWLARLRSRTDRATFRWILEDGEVQGGIVLRHRGDEQLGHIGYGIRPSARGRGLATWALGAILSLAQELWLSTVDVWCEAGNRPSAVVIERNGGRILNTHNGYKQPLLHYKIDLATPMDSTGE